MYQRIFMKYVKIMILLLFLSNVLCYCKILLSWLFSLNREILKYHILRKEKTVWKIILWNCFHWFQSSREFHIFAPLNRFKTYLPNICDLECLCRYARYKLVNTCLTFFRRYATWNITNFYEFVASREGFMFIH